VTAGHSPMSDMALWRFPSDQKNGDTKTRNQIINAALNTSKNRETGYMKFLTPAEGQAVSGKLGVYGQETDPTTVFIYKPIENSKERFSLYYKYNGVDYPIFVENNDKTLQVNSDPNSPPDLFIIKPPLEI